MSEITVEPGADPVHVLDAIKAAKIHPPHPARKSRHGKRIGQPPRIHPQLVEDVCALIAAGATHEDAAEAVGVSRSTLYSWKARGREARSVIEGSDQKPAKSELIYLDFLDRIERAQGQGAVTVTEKLRELAMGQAVRSVTLVETDDGEEIRHIEFVPPSVRALTFMLERRYGWKHAIELSGSDDAPISVEVEVSARDALRKKLGSVAARIGEEPAEEPEEDGG